MTYVIQGSPLSTIFGTWKKPYYAKFVLVELISTSTNLPSKSPTSTDIDCHQLIPLPPVPGEILYGGAFLFSYLSIFSREIFMYKKCLHYNDAVKIDEICSSMKILL